MLHTKCWEHLQNTLRAIITSPTIDSQHQRYQMGVTRDDCQLFPRYINVNVNCNGRTITSAVVNVATQILGTIVSRWKWGNDLKIYNLCSKVGCVSSCGRNF